MPEAAVLMLVGLLVGLEKTKTLLLTFQEAQKSLHRLQQQAALSRFPSDPHLTTGHGLEGMRRLKCEPAVRWVQTVLSMGGTNYLEF